MTSVPELLRRLRNFWTFWGVSFGGEMLFYWRIPNVSTLFVEVFRLGPGWRLLEVNQETPMCRRFLTMALLDLDPIGSLSQAASGLPVAAAEKIARLCRAT